MDNERQYSWRPGNYAQHSFNSHVRSRLQEMLSRGSEGLLWRTKQSKNTNLGSRSCRGVSPASLMRYLSASVLGKNKPTCSPYFMRGWALSFCYATSQAKPLTMCRSRPRWRSFCRREWCTACVGDLSPGSLGLRVNVPSVKIRFVFHGPPQNKANISDLGQYFCRSFHGQAQFCFHVCLP